MDLITLTDRIRSYDPQGDIENIKLAYAYAMSAHQGQRRRSGEEFFIHPVEVAAILAELQMDSVTIVAGLLHDVVEDTTVSLEEIEKNFGAEVALLVDGVTKLSRIDFKSKMEQQVENLRKMFLAMAKDIRVIIIKLADRLHNMRTLKFQAGEKQIEIAQETVEIFAPLAHRLGIFRLKWELEDLSLRYLDSDRYYELVQSISLKRKEREEYLQYVISILQQKIEEMGIKADIQGRPKHFYSIYNKMIKQGKGLEEIYDLVAVRVIVDNVKDCYGTLGIIHSLWKPIPGRFKDYIAMPKPNMYQSLHTSVMGPYGEPFEVQIRTWEMHRTSEYGIAAHWRYKEGKSGDKDFDAKLTWLRQLLEWQRELRDARDFMESLKIDLFSDRVYVFTPKGDVVELPAGSIPLDFAYRVHTAVGNQCVGAKVNNKIVPLDYRLQTGDIVEILTAKSQRPRRDWLSMVQTSQAKNRIKQWLKKEQREELVAKGKELLEKECEKRGWEAGEVLKPQFLAEAGKKFNIVSAEDTLLTVGDGGLTPSQVITKLKEIVPGLSADTLVHVPIVKPWTGYGKASQGIRVKGIDNVVVRLSRCCNPVPGDDITGYITRGRGVSIHRKDCPNIAHHNESEKERIIQVAWDAEAEATFQVHIEALAMDRPKLAMDIMTTVADTKTIINSIHARATKNNLAVVDLKLEIKGLEHLNFLVEKIKRVKDVMDVKRITPSSAGFMQKV
jgi:GTP pyrophosphokinase